MQKIVHYKLVKFLKLIKAKKVSIFWILFGLLVFHIIYTSFCSYYRDIYLNNLKLTQYLTLKNDNNNQRCLKSEAYFTDNDTKELKNFLDFLNNFQYKYFLCFSTLFYAVKIEKYIVYREKDLTLNAIESLMESERSQKCLLETDSNKYSININLCLLNDKNHTNFCNYYTLMNKNCKCSYNYLNGEYELDCETRLKIIIHEYKIIKKKYILFDKENYDDISILNAGLLGYLLKLNLDLPTYLFYNYENSYYLNYANNVFRLPSDVINYFMIFYSNLWYK